MSVSVLPAWRPDGAFCGRDGERGGSWQGVSESGLMVAITNRLEGPLDPIVRSRGQLCLDALRQPTSADAIDWVLGYLQRQSYNLFNLICADARQVLVLHYAGQPDVRDLQPGSHVVADTDADDRRHPRIERAGELLAGIGSASWDEVMPALARIMADHAGEGEGTALSPRRRVGDGSVLTGGGRGNRSGGCPLPLRPGATLHARLPGPVEADGGQALIGPITSRPPSCPGPSRWGRRRR